MNECQKCKHKYFDIKIRSSEKKRKRKRKEEQMRKIQQDSNQKFKEMTDIIFKNNDNLKRDYERFMRFQHNAFLSVQIFCD